MASNGVRIVEVASEEDARAARALIVEYAAWICSAYSEDACFDESLLELDLLDFPSKYTAVLLARTDEEPVGVVCMKRYNDGTCVMCRLWVRPAHQGNGLGRALCEAFLRAAAQRHFAAVRLDSILRLHGAVQLYRKLGFQEIEPYGNVRIWRDSVFLEKKL